MTIIYKIVHYIFSFLIWTVFKMLYLGFKVDKNVTLKRIISILNLLTHILLEFLGWDNFHLEEKIPAEKYSSSLTRSLSVQWVCLLIQSNWFCSVKCLHSAQLGYYCRDKKEKLTQKCKRKKASIKYTIFKLKKKNIQMFSKNSFVQATLPFKNVICWSIDKAVQRNQVFDHIIWKVPFWVIP